MIYRNASNISVLVEFPSGFPDGNIAWALYNEEGIQVDSGSVTPTPNAVSATIVVPSASNTLAGTDLSGFRDLMWSYTVASEIINGDMRYNIEARPPWGATEAGVRGKLGIAPHELPDEDISLVRAYYDFLTISGDPDLTSFAPTARERLALSDAVEAVAALAALPTLQYRAPQKESSGTDTFQRADNDWELLTQSLRTTIADGIMVIVPGFDPLAGFGSLFLVATQATDPFTG